MQTFSKALIELVLDEKVDREIAANAASNRHDFLIALDRAMKEQAAGAHLDAVADPEEEPEPPAEEVVGEAEDLPRLRVAGQQ
jgi:hypothetical protein